MFKSLMYLECMLCKTWLEINLNFFLCMHRVAWKPSVSNLTSPLSSEVPFQSHWNPVCVRSGSGVRHLRSVGFCFLVMREYPTFLITLILLTYEYLSGQLVLSLPYWHHAGCYCVLIWHIYNCLVWFAKVAFLLGSLADRWLTQGTDTFASCRFQRAWLSASPTSRLLQWHGQAVISLRAHTFLTVSSAVLSVW